MKKHTIPMISGDEMDALTGWRKYLGWGPGIRKSIKRRYNRRMRRIENRQANEIE